VRALKGRQFGVMTKMIIMGVSGAGKSTLGLAMSNALGWQFLDADDFHTDAAKAKIASGHVLDETDRAAWLAAVSPALNLPGQSKVLACSALKASHRDSLEPDVLVYLVMTPDMATKRLTERTGHFAGPSIVPSQFATLEVPTDAIEVPAHWPTVDQVAFILDRMPF
jgi:gluconokinase